MFFLENYVMRTVLWVFLPRLVLWKRNTLGGTVGGAPNFLYKCIRVHVIIHVHQKGTFAEHQMQLVLPSL